MGGILRIFAARVKFFIFRADFPLYTGDHFDRAGAEDRPAPLRPHGKLLLHIQRKVQRGDHTLAFPFP